MHFKVKEPVGRIRTTGTWEVRKRRKAGCTHTHTNATHFADMESVEWN